MEWHLLNASSSHSSYSLWARRESTAVGWPPASAWLPCRRSPHISPNSVLVSLLLGPMAWHFLAATSQSSSEALPRISGMKSGQWNKGVAAMLLQMAGNIRMATVLLLLVRNAAIRTSRPPKNSSRLITSTIDKSSCCKAVAATLSERGLLLRECMGIIARRTVTPSLRNFLGGRSARLRGTTGCFGTRHQTTHSGAKWSKRSSGLDADTGERCSTGVIASKKVCEAL